MKDKLKMLAFVLICGTLLTAALVFVDEYTKPIIATNESLKLKRNVLQAFGIAYGEKDVEAIFASSVKVGKAENLEFYVNSSGDVAAPFSGGGLWGPIVGIIALSPDLTTLRDITIMRQEETPGLGSRIAERSHLDKFKGKSVAVPLVSVGAGKAKTDSEVDAITGATLSCNAIIEILNKNLGTLLPILKGATR